VAVSHFIVPVLESAVLAQPEHDGTVSSTVIVPHALVLTCLWQSRAVVDRPEGFCVTHYMRRSVAVLVAIGRARAPQSSRWRDLACFLVSPIGFKSP